MRSVQVSCRRPLLVAIVVAAAVATLLPALPAEAGRIDVYVSGGGGVVKHNAVTGEKDTGFSLPADGTILKQPQGVAVGPDDLLYVVSQDNFKILKRDRYTGADLGTLASGLNSPNDVMFGRDFSGDGVPDLYFSDWTHEVKRIPTEGPGAGVINAFTNHAGPSPVIPLYDATFGPDGKLYASGKDASQVAKYNGTTGTLEGIFVSPGTMLGGITWGPDGNFYVGTYEGTGGVMQYNASGGLLDAAFVATSNLKYTMGLAFGPDQNYDGVSDLYATATAGGIANVVRVFSGANGAMIDGSFISHGEPRKLYFLDSAVGKRSFLSTADAELMGRSDLRNIRTGNSPHSWLGRDSSVQDDISRVVMRFDISDVPGGWVGDGEGTLYLYADPDRKRDQFIGHEMEIYEMSQANANWDEDEVTWNEKRSGQGWDHSDGMTFVTSAIWDGASEFAIPVPEAAINHWLNDLGGKVNLVLMSTSAEQQGSFAASGWFMWEHGGTEMDPRLVFGIRVPEPGSFVLLALGSLALVAIRRRKR